MKLLQDLINIKAPPGLKTSLREAQESPVNYLITEARREGDMSDLIEKYCDQEKMYHFEGGRGVNNFEKIIRVLGYRQMDDFLEDNSGCLQAMVEWLGTQNNTEWVEAMQNEIQWPEGGFAEDDGDK